MREVRPCRPWSQRKSGIYGACQPAGTGGRAPSGLVPGPTALAAIGICSVVSASRLVLCATSAAVQ